MPEITEVFYPRSRAEWHDWLERNHASKSEIWVQLFKKASGMPSLPYDDLVEECLRWGWIDGVVKKLDADSRAQRITPRRKRSFLSELNRQRVWKLEREGLMTGAGWKALGDKVGSADDTLAFPDWIKNQLQADKEVWQTFIEFPYFYRRLKIGWIAEAGNRREVAQKRLDYLIKMTRAGKQYGTQPLRDWEVNK